MSPATGPSSFDPFRAATTAGNAATTRCPKCQWAQPPERTSCAACGLIFARYAAAQARSSSANKDVFSPPTSPAAVIDPLREPLPSFGVGTASAGSIVGSALSSSTSTVLSLLGLHAVPLLVFAAVGALAATAVPVALQAWPLLTGAKLVMAAIAGGVVAVLVWLLLMRVMVTVSVGTTLIVDEHMRTGDNRGAFAALGEGWQHSGRVLGLCTVIAAATLLPVAPVALLAWKSSPGLLMVSSLAWCAFVVVRSAVAIPAVVLGDRSVVGALRESWSLTDGRFFGTAGVVVLGALVMMVVSGICAAISWIPIVGAVVGLAGSVVVAGIGAGVSAGLWRDRVAG